MNLDHYIQAADERRIADAEDRREQMEQDDLIAWKLRASIKFAQFPDLTAAECQRLLSLVGGTCNRQREYTATVGPWGFDIDCTYEYWPGEPCIMWPTERAHPGSPPEAGLHTASIGGVDITEMLNDDQIERLADAIILQEHSDD